MSADTGRNTVDLPLLTVPQLRKPKPNSLCRHRGQDVVTMLDERSIERAIEIRGREGNK